MESIIVLANRDMAAVLFSAYYAKTIIDMKTTISLNQPLRKARMANTLSSWLASDNRLFSWILSQGEDEKVAITNLQALYLFQAIFTGSLLICASSANFTVLIVLLCWFVLSLYQCKKGGLK